MYINACDSVEAGAREFDPVKSASRRFGGRRRRSSAAFPSPFLGRKGHRGFGFPRRGRQLGDDLQEMLISLEQRGQLLLRHVHAAHV